MALVIAPGIALVTAGARGARALPIVVVLLLATAGVSAQGTAPAAGSAVAPNDYSVPDTWLCHPGRRDACAVDLTTTIVSGDGSLRRESWQPPPAPPIDCFYVYPTVSTDASDNSDMTADPAERNVVRTQLARFASQCRLFAPLYRQITLAGLRKARSGGGASAIGRGLAYDDVLAAWRHYLQHDNAGRGVVLIGHSQGSGVLQELIRREIDGKPVQAQLVSALLLGTTLAVPKGRAVGGAFQHVPLCRDAAETGCVIAYASYRATVPPPSNTIFGRVPGGEMVAACTNPAALGGGTGALHAYLSADGTTVVGRRPVKPWVSPGPAVTTPWVSVPGLLTARCTANEHASGYLEVTVHGNPTDPRVDDITGDVGNDTQIQADWGLHLIDVELALGNLVDIVGRQARAYGAKAR